MKAFKAVLFVFALLFFAAAASAVYWVSPTGTAAWANCSGSTPLSGTSACSLATANTNAIAGNIVYIRAGTYSISGSGINPSNTGTAGNMITFSSYNNENVTFIGASASSQCVNLDSEYSSPIRSYIKVHGINCRNFGTHLWIRKGSHNEISNSTFIGMYSTTSLNWRGSTIYRNAKYNWVHHSTFGDYGDFAGGGDNAVVFELGCESCVADDTHHNLIEYNHFYHGGHHVVGMGGHHNVFRYNYMHNENWSPIDNPTYGNRITFMVGVTGDTYRNLVEGNRIAYGGETSEPDQIGGSGGTVASPYNIIRKNMYYQALIYGSYFTHYTGNTDSAYNHVYNNVYWHNGYSTSGPLKSNWDDALTHAIMVAEGSGSTVHDNVFKNNIFYDNKNLRGSQYPIIEPYPEYNQPDFQTISGNWMESGDPKFVNISGTPDPMNETQFDFHLQSDSPAIDIGGFLTIINSMSGSGTQFVVADAGYFMDGWDIIEGDVIQLDGQTQRATITNVDYTTNMITVNTPLTWINGQGISLAYEGYAPDLGAYEYYEAAQPTCTDSDGDGYGAAGSSGCPQTGTDCNDTDASVHPGATEKCGDGKDNDCSGGDASCSNCSQGAIPSTGCKCGSTNYYSGYCCDGFYQVNSCSGLDYFAFEAENGVLVSPMGSVSDSTASGGKYIRTITESSGTADYAFSASGGNYVVWALSRVGTGDPNAHNSFYVLMDGSGEDVWHVPPTYAVWTWDQVSGVSAGDPRAFNLAAGNHTLRFRGRETDTRLDKLIVTNDLNYNPAAPQCIDSDGDGYGANCAAGADCNDANPSINPGAAESCSDAIDNDCDSFVDCLDPNCSANSVCTQCPVGQILCNNVCITSACSSNVQCNDSNVLTNDVCLNAGTCNASCSFTPYPGCGEIISSNCSCGGSIYSTGLCCNSVYRAQAVCNTDAQCDDQNSLTNDACLNAGTCSAVCSNTSIGQPVCSEGQTTACVTTDNCAGTRTCSNNAWGDCVKDNPLCPIPPVCSEGQTIYCVTLDNCAGTQTCISNAWTSCTKLDPRCPLAVGDLDADGVPSSTDCNDVDASIGLCTGCASCAGGRCIAGSCPSTACTEKSECKGEHYYSYPATVSNECTLQGGLGTCTAKKCIPSISLNDSRCTIPGQVTQPPEIPGEITEKPPQIEEMLPIQIIAAAIVLVAVGVIAIVLVLRKR